MYARNTFKEFTYVGFFEMDIGDWVEVYKNTRQHGSSKDEPS